MRLPWSHCAQVGSRWGSCASAVGRSRSGSPAGSFNLQCDAVSIASDPRSKELCGAALSAHVAQATTLCSGCCRSGNAHDRNHCRR
eukprot:1183634-Amphidinium_carterae.1